MVIKCENGHWYDAGLYKTCPHCRQQGEKVSIRPDDVKEDDRTVAFSDVSSSLEDELESVLGKPGRKPQSEDEAAEKTDIFRNIRGTANIYDSSRITASPGRQPDGIKEEEDKTIAFGFPGFTDVAPVTGWLICLNGEQRGRDFRLHAGRNFIGRSTRMDIALVDDRTISREKHGSVVYDPKGNAFYLSGEGGNLVYLNGKLLKEPEKLQDGDIISAGETKLLFVPFCVEGRTWKDIENENQENESFA